MDVKWKKRPSPDSSVARGAGLGIQNLKKNGRIVRICAISQSRTYSLLDEGILN
jgi:hypothetical protein